MNDINWFQAGIGFLSGGAFGALIKQYFDNKKNRIQPIKHFIDLNSLYASFENKLIDSELVLKDSTGEYKFKRIFTGSLKLINSGNQDYGEFIFGLGISEGSNFIQAKATTKDRHHNLEISNEPRLSNQISTLDIHLKPFNRNDEYRIDFLVSSDQSNVRATDIQISSPHPIKWIGFSDTADLIRDIARSTILKIGPFSISINT